MISMYIIHFELTKKEMSNAASKSKPRLCSTKYVAISMGTTYDLIKKEN